MNYTNENYGRYRTTDTNNECSNCNSSITPLIIIGCVVTFIYTAPCLFVWIARIIAYFRKLNINDDLNDENSEEDNRTLDIIRLDYNRNNPNIECQLPKYQGTEQLSDSEIYFTLPPRYEESFHTVDSNFDSSTSSRSISAATISVLTE